MAQYHISGSGTTAICKAAPGNCPLGGRHFRTKDEADFYAQLNETVPATAPTVQDTARDELSEMMDFGALIRTVKGRPHDVTVFDNFDYVESTQYVDLDADGSVSEPIAPAGWEYLKGFSSQYGYNGPIMHSDEVIDGGLADYMLTHPGYYRSVIIDGMYAFPTDDGEDSESVGWGILHHIG